MAPISSVGFPKQLEKAIDKMFYQEYMSLPTEYDKVAKISKAPAGGNYREAELSGLGTLRTLPEGTGIVFDSPVEGNDVTRYYTAYGLGFQITEIMLEDDYHKKIMNMNSDLAKSAAYKPDAVFWDLFNSGFATHTARDGQYIFDASGRTLLKTGAAQNNRPAADAELSETSLQAAIEYGQTAKDSAGRPIKLIPKMLIVPTQLQWTAQVLLGTEKKVGSMDNDMNTVNKLGLKQFTSINLTSPTAWFVLFENHDFNVLWKRQATVQQSDDFLTGNRLVKATSRFAAFCNNPTECYGTTGA